MVDKMCIKLLRMIFLFMAGAMCERCEFGLSLFLVVSYFIILLIEKYIKEVIDND